MPTMTSDELATLINEIMTVLETNRNNPITGSEIRQVLSDICTVVLGQVDLVDEELTTTEGTLTTATTDIATLNGQVAEQETDLGEINTQVGILGTQIAGILAAPPLDANITEANTSAAYVGRSVINAPIDLLGTDGMRAGQGVFGLQNVRPMIGSEGVRDAQISGGTPGSPGSTTGWVVSGYIPVIPGSTMTVGIDIFSGIGGHPNNQFFTYGPNRNHIASDISPSSSTWANGETFTVPAGVFFIRFAMDYRQIHQIKLYQGTVATADMRHKWQGMASTVHMHRPWTGRTWMLCGDSMGYTGGGNSWFSDVAKYHGCAFIHNNAISGGTVTAGGNTIMNKYNRPTDFSRVPFVLPGDFTNIHAVITQVGVNDLAVAAPIGTINDTPATATFYGQYINFIEMVLGANPYLKLILSPPSGRHYPGGSGGGNRTGNGLYATRSPWQGTGGSNADVESDIQPYRDAVYALCDRYALNCWDVSRHSQMSAYTALAYSLDGLHPSYNGPRGDGNPAHDWIPVNYGSKLMFGSSLAAYMHTVFPSDWTGDPWIAEDDGNYNPEQI